MRLLPLAIVLLPLVLAGCGVPDLVATGVKSYENRTEAQGGSNAAPPSPAPAPVQAAAPIQPPAPVQSSAPVGGGLPPPERVTIEPLK